MDMSTRFKFSIDGQECEFSAECWQDALHEFLRHCETSGFEIPERKHLQMLEFARFNRITVRED